MSKGFGIHGSTTDHGGSVVSTQSRSSQMGILFLRAGDGFACPKCKIWSTLIKSNDHVIFDGKAVAYVGDKFTCGATLMPKQAHVVGTSGGSTSSSVSNFQTTSQQNNNLVNNFSEMKEKYENYYIEINKTDYVKFRNALPPYDSDKFGKRGGGVIIQTVSGACEFIVTYVVRGIELFVTVSYMPPVLKQEAKIYPWASLKLYQQDIREFEFIESHKLEMNPGYWDNSRGKEPVGSCTLKLPKPNLDVMKIVLELGYQAKFDGGIIVPIPSFVAHSFTLTSAARRVQ